MSYLLLSLLLALAGSFLMERVTKPRPRLWDRPVAALLLHLAVVTTLFLIFLLLSQRPLFSALAALVTLSIVTIVSNAKFLALREPLLISDFVLFSQAFKHPRLYLPFLGIVPTLTGLIFAAIAIYGGIVFEPPLFSLSAPTVYFAGGLLVSVSLLYLSIRVGASLLTPSLDPNKDVEAFGLIASLLGYLLLSRREDNRAAVEKAVNEGPFRPAAKNKAPPEGMPHIVVIQSESFFDVRRLQDSINRSILKQYDAVLSESLLYGRLRVPAWGAYTMRSEFGFLTGIAGERLGFERFDPYCSLARRPLPSLASHLRALGYRTLCIHPYPITFFGRDKVFPGLGFDEFIDIEAFEGAATSGPYIGDSAITDKIIEILDKSEKPTFLFAITMENHGPLHLEEVNSDEEARFYRGPPPPDSHDLTVYLRHLVQADRMIGRLSERLKESPSMLCLYGDHIPSMPKVYRALDYNDGATDYFLWTTDSETPQKRDIGVEDLARLISNRLEGREPG